MKISGRSCIAAFMASLILLTFTAPAFPSYNTEAGRKYAIACQRLADLRKSQKKKKYRSYWVDCIRTFEMVEKKYPKSSHAADACFDRAGLYSELYQFNKYSRDLDASLQNYEKCQAIHPKHEKAPEALYRIIDLSLEFKKHDSFTSKAYAKLVETYPASSWTARAKTRTGNSARTTTKQEPEIRKIPVVPVISSGKAIPIGTVKGIRHWSGGAYTRIVIDQDKPIKFQAHELKNPDRLVFDLMNAKIGDTINKDPLPVNDGILKQVRANQFTANTVRVVLDLASIKNYAAFPLHDPERLVIDVTGEGGRTEAPGAEVQTENKGTGGQNQAIPRMPEVKNNNGEKYSLSSQMGLKIQTIAIDAGHGGHDPGAIGKNGLQEKTITLDIAKRLAALVKERLGCNVVMTRNKDVFVPLDQRPFIAKSNDADLFVSIHVNANRKRQAKGIETYIQSLTASDREAMATAARENAMSTKKLSELKTEVEKILDALDRDNKLEDSLQLAHAVQGSLIDTVKPVQPHVVNLGVKRAFFYVLINTQMPSILAEVGFISNPDEEKLLRKGEYRQKIAEALFQGVKRFIEARSPQMLGV